MELIGVKVQMPANSPIVVLREETGQNRVLPIFIGLMLYMIDPHLMAPMVESLPGLAVLATMFVMEILGYFFIYKITNIEV